MDFKMTGKKLVCLALSFVLLFCVMTIPELPQKTYAANSVSENKSKQDELKKQNEELKNTLDQVKSDVEEQTKYKQALDEQISVVQQQIDLSNEQIRILDEQIVQKQAAISETQQKIDKNFDLLKQRLKAIYMAGETSTLDIILGAKDFKDFLDKAEIVKHVSAHDSDLINSLQNDMKSIESEKNQVEADRITVSEEKKNLDVKQSELNSLLEESNRIISKLESEKANMLDQIDQNDAEMQRIESEIQAYYTEQAAKEAQVAANNGSSSGDVDTPYVPSSSSGYTWPVPGYYYVISDFYDTEDRTSMHGAIDITGSGICGKPIVAADGGKVVQGSIGGWGGGYGTYLMIDHGNGKSTLYAHMSGAAVSIGQTVSKGQVIGYVGSTGFSTGAHLHFETRRYGQRYDPMTEF